MTPSEPSPTVFQRLKRAVRGGARDLSDRSVYHTLAIPAFLAWVGLGTDGLSSSCYGPQEAFLALGSHTCLAVFVALATAVTVVVISASYSQIIELFPSGGGGYLVASKLLSSRAGAVCGCALLVDYVLTIALSIASGADALFSFLPLGWQPWKVSFALAAIGVMTLLNIRGARESVTALVPVFLLFLVSHVFLVVYAVGTHATEVGHLGGAVVADVRTAGRELGLFGVLFLMMHSYSMGAGTYTGIEAVSNGMALLREPRVQTAKRTMTYMWVSLSVAVLGLTAAYLLYGVTPQAGKTLNAVLAERATAAWSAPLGRGFVVVTLVSDAVILFVASQTGFLGGSRILANLALDRWLPTRLSLLSDRLVVQNGVLLMSTAAAVTVLLTRGSVSFLVVLYSINVFITFALSQTGMVRHWWIVRQRVADWRRRLAINGLGLAMTVFILVWMTVAKFFEGGWVTLVVTGGLLVVVLLIRRHYDNVAGSVIEFNRVSQALLSEASQRAGNGTESVPVCDTSARTAVVLVGGYNGLGLHSTLNVIRYFGNTFRNFVFVSVGVIDAGNFKGAAETERLDRHVRGEAERYATLMREQGFHAESVCAVGTDIADEIARLAPQIVARFPHSVFFAGQLIFPRESFLTRLLHNNIVFAIQQRIYRQGIAFVVLPFRV